MKSTYSNVVYVTFFCLIMFVSSGCALFRYNIIPQEKKGPHGGEVVLIDQRMPEYIEFVVIPADKEWTFQIYSYNRNLRPNSISCSGYLKLEFPNRATKGGDLLTTTPYFWSKGIGHLENKIELNNIKEFSATVIIYRGRTRDQLHFKYPY